MIYSSDNFYFINNKKFPIEKTILVTTKTISKWCRYYKVGLIFAKKGFRNLQKSGKLPENSNEKEVFIEDIFRWIYQRSDFKDSFTLFLDSKPIGVNRLAKFDHHDDSCCWFLNLSENEFNELQEIWKNNNLPIDLFYPSDQSICVIPGGQDWRSKLKRFFGWQYCFSPKQWEQVKKRGEVYIIKKNNSAKL